MVLCKQRQLWVKRHWEMLQFSFMKMKAFACFYGLWGFVSSVSILAGVAWASPASLSLACQGLPWGQVELWFSCREGGTVQHPLRGSVHGDRMRRPGWWAPDQWFSKDIASPQTHECQSGSSVYGVPQQLGNLRAAAILFSLASALCSGLCLPSHFLRRLPNCPPSWFISVEIWEQVEDTLVSAFLYLELSLVPFVLNFFVCGL